MRTECRWIAGVVVVRCGAGMALLYYWRPDNYQRDLDFGAGFHLNQGNPVLHQVEIGDSVWAFTRNGQGRYVLAAEVVVRAKTRNRPDFRYGPYRVWGDLTRSRYFRADGQADQEPVIRAVSGRHEARMLGRAFQGRAAVRIVNGEGHRMLAAAAKELELEPRARLLPEDALEAQVVLGDPAGVARLIQKEDPGIAEERRKYLYGTSVSKNAGLTAELQTIYEGKCQLCQWDPRRTYGDSICEAHHIVWLSRGGEDLLTNLALLCPNHHRAVHRMDAPLDWADMTFDFGVRRERVVVDRHLWDAAGR
jgi:5-methylcytosine-specific restriction protein A